MSTARFLLLQQPSGGFAPVAFPTSGTLYTASADGVYVLGIDQPASPNYLDRIELWVRAQTVNTTNTYNLDDGWLIRLEYQTDATWDAKAGSVSSGTTNFNFTAADVGASVTALAWDLSGSTLKAFYSTTADPAYPADFTQIGSDITSALYQTVAAVGASYSGASGSQLLSNNDFSAWTADNPDSWAVFTEDAGNFVTQVGATSQANMVTNGLGGYFQMRQTPLTVGIDYVAWVDVVSITGSFLHRYINNSQTISTSGLTANRGEATSTQYQFAVNAAVADIVFNAAYLYATAALDNGSDGALNLRKVA